ncbi:single-stranded DNA-binding protein [Neolewinella litorea]|uniref:Single-stranded DNA-binding protein n=1 Tax=Neolewinella litorea TaxID=2562452 RepID=A0A4V3XLM7_9BACT|nr:single-stranded DNA-binding protein [Neolewinella litorea]THH41493.1 single-stranded DNA-binding protein [Neolewinella litorea]
MYAFHNHLQLVGRIGHDPELKILSDGSPLLRLRLYQNPGRADTAREPQVHQLIAWNDVARKMHALVRRGDRLLVHGKLINRKRKHQSQTIWQTEVHISYFAPLKSAEPIEEQTQYLIH